MKRQFAIGSGCLLAIYLAGCSGGAPVNSPIASGIGPQTSFASPAPDSALPIGPVTIVAQSLDSSGLARIELLVNGEIVTTGENPDPASSFYALDYVWQPAAGGEYNLQARGQNRSGVWGTYASESIVIAAEPTATETATLQPSATSAPSLTPTQLIAPTSTPGPTILPTATDSNIKLDWTIAYNQMYAADSKCGTTTNMATAVVSPPDPTYSVLLFFHIGNKAGTEWKPWTSGLALGPTSTPGKSYILFTSRHIANPVPWIPAKVEYQFVVIKIKGPVLYRTPVYSTSLAIIKCP